jgi:phospholipid transport system substrate-binding protein
MRFSRIAALGLLVLLAFPVRASAPTPTGTVEELHAGFISVMKQADALGFAGRAEALASAVDRAFDLEFMAIKTLGLAARDLVPSDRDRWVAAFTRFVVSNYARRFKGYSGQRFESLAEEPAPSGQVVVWSRLVRPQDDEVRLDYRLRLTEDGWKIIDVYARGTTSMLALRRAEFASVLDREGFNALVASVQTRATRE